MKRLDITSANYVQHLKDQGLSVKGITAQLTADGFVSVTGKPLTDSNVSNFMCANGMRTKERVVKKDSDDLKEQKKSLNNIVLEIFNNSLLSKEQKIKTIEGLL